jgi:hypothetical protein
MANINAYWYHKTISKLREFYVSRGFMEVYPQSKPSFLAVADSTSTLMTYDNGGEKFLLPQTAHMWLEQELLKNPEFPGVFSVSTSYRHYKNPVANRHESVFPIFDFEMPGTIEAGYKIQAELLEYLGFVEKGCTAPEFLYDDVTSRFGVRRIDGSVESRLYKDNGPAVIIKNRPESVQPSWLVTRADDVAIMSNAILYGVETVSVMERSTNSGNMRKRFYEINDGNYAQDLFDLFGQARVERELGEYLSYDFFPRCSGSVGLVRLVRALRNQESDKWKHANDLSDE